MPTNRTRINRGIRTRISPEAIAAWHSCNYRALHAILRLAPGEASPLPSCINALGVAEDEQPYGANLLSVRSWPKALELQREFLRVAGWPEQCRLAYEKNLRDAQETARYLQGLVDDPGSGPRHRVNEMANRLAALERAKEEVAYRRKLFHEVE